MSTITQQPDSISLLGNLKDFIVTSGLDVAFQLLEGATVIIDENYSPDADGKVTISLKDILANLMTVSVPDGTTDVTEQPGAAKAYTADIDGTQVNFTVLKAGVDATVDPSVWLKANWLTWQPQTKYVKYTDPQWLSYFAVVDVNVKLKAYFIDNSTETITFASLTAGSVYSLNVLFASIRSKFTNQPTYFDIWTEDTGATRLSYIQRIVLENIPYEYNDVFVFENTAGGIDTARLTGKLTEKDGFAYDQAEFDDEAWNYDLDYSKGAEKNTGYIEDSDTRKWTKELLTSVQVYHLVEGELRKIAISNNDQKADPAELNSFTFSFLYSKKTRYLNLSRADNPSDPIQIVAPDATLFFLAPRLSDFPNADARADLIFPVQSPFTETWQQLSLQAFRSSILEDVAGMVNVTPGSAWSDITGKPFDELDTNFFAVSSGKLQVSWKPDWSDIKNKPDEAIRWPSWAEVTGKPTAFTPAVHGNEKHSEAYLTESFFNSLFAYDAANDRIVAQKDLFSLGTLTAYYSGAGASGGAVMALYQLTDVDPDVVNAVDGDLLVYSGTHFTRLNRSGLAPASHTHPISDIIGLQAALDSKEPSLGNPSADGYLLSSTASGFRSWVAPYAHPTQSAISKTLSGATVLASLTVNTLGHVTGVTTRSMTLANLGYTGDTNANYYVHPSYTSRSVSTGVGQILSSFSSDGFGHVTGISLRSLQAGDIPALAISKITGLQTALDNKVETSYLSSLFQYDAANDRIIAQKDLFSLGTLTAYYSGSGASGGPAVALFQLSDVDADVENSNVNDVLQFDGTHWKHVAVSTAIGGNLTNYYTKTQSDGMFARLTESNIFTGLTQTLKTTSSGVNLVLDSAPGTYRNLIYRTSGTNRWDVYAGVESETGGNAGTDFHIANYTDAGVFKNNVFTIYRSTGEVVVNQFRNAGQTRLGSTGGYYTYLYGAHVLMDYATTANKNGRFYYQNDAFHFRGGGTGETDVVGDTSMYIRSGGAEQIVYHAGNSNRPNVNWTANNQLTYGGTSYYAPATNSLAHIMQPGGATFSTAGYSTGAIKITLPATWTNTMMSMWVDIYDYKGDSNGESISIHLGGYNYSASATWYNTFAHTITTRNDKFFNVRFGHDGTNCAIYIGETTSTWDYLKVVVRNVTIGHSVDVNIYQDGWSLGIASTLGTITKTTTSGLNANYLNGQSASYYDFRNYGLGYGALNVNDLTASDINYARFFRFLSSATGSGGYTGAAISLPYDGTPSTAILGVGGSGPFWGWKSSETANPSFTQIWHAGNDGAGSGLDSDLLDGKHGSYYLQFNSSLDVRDSSIFPSTDGTGTYMPVPGDSFWDDKERIVFNSDGGRGTWSGILSVKGWHASTYAMWQLSGTASTTTDGQLYYRDGLNNTWNTWNKIWHSGNSNKSTVDWYMNSAYIGGIRMYNSGGSLYTNANFYSLGTLTAYVASDFRLKYDLEPLKNPVGMLRQLKGLSFNYTDEGLKLLGRKERHDIGLIAQDVKAVIPEAVRTMWGTDYLGYDSDKIIPVLVEALKEAWNEIDKLKQERTAA